MPHIDIRSQKQQDKDERTLCLDELHHKDMEYQLKITHVEYIDRDTRGISLPNYDLKKHSTFRKRKQFWIAYAGSDIRVVHEDFFLNIILMTQIKNDFLETLGCTVRFKTMQIKNFH